VCGESRTHGDNGGDGETGLRIPRSVPTHWLCVLSLPTYVDGHRKRERIGPDKRLAETVLRKRKVEVAEGKYLDKQRPIVSTFDDLADAYLKWISPNQEAGIPARKRS
jgi:hypothetical protein